MYRQLELFQQYKQLVRALIGGDRTKRLVNEALILITVGGNDFVNNYYLVPNSARSSQFALPDYVKYLISEYRKLLMVISSLFHLFIKAATSINWAVTIHCCLC